MLFNHIFQRYIELLTTSHHLVRNEGSIPFTRSTFNQELAKMCKLVTGILSSPK